jgi:hypothetical protein
MKPAESGEKKATRHCWECLKKRLVCDYTLPHCKKCIKNGKECPGYDEQKPLQWVEPGKVTSRRRKKDSPPKVYTIRPKDREAVATTALSLPVVSSEDSDESDSSGTVAVDGILPLELPVFDEPQVTKEIVDLYKCQLAYALLNTENKTWWNSLRDDEREEHLTIMATKYEAGASAADRILKIGNKKKIQAVVQGGQHREAALLLRSGREPLERLQRLLWFMEMQDLPSYDHLTNETCEVVQAVNYCLCVYHFVKLLLTLQVNSRIYPDSKATDVLAPNLAIIMFPMYALHFLPPAMHHTLVCLSLNHFIHTLPAGSDRAIIASNRSKVYKYRGLAIRALSENVAKEKTRSSDLTIGSILMFMAMEVSWLFLAWRGSAEDKPAGSKL